MSLCYVTMASTKRVLTNNPTLRHKILKLLTTKWADSDPTTVEPPYCEALINHLPTTLQRRPV